MLTCLSILVFDFEALHFWKGDFNHYLRGLEPGLQRWKTLLARIAMGKVSLFKTFLWIISAVYKVFIRFPCVLCKWFGFPANYIRVPHSPPRVLAGWQRSGCWKPTEQLMHWTIWRHNFVILATLYHSSSLFTSLYTTSCLFHLLGWVIFCAWSLLEWLCGSKCVTGQDCILLFVVTCVWGTSLFIIRRGLFLTFFSFPVVTWMVVFSFSERNCSGGRNNI